MQVTLEILTGPFQGKQVVIRPGQVVRVGRFATADWPIPHDALMSNLHFAVACDERTGRLCDLNSRFGTVVNGVKTTEAVLQDGDRIVAGQTTLGVRVDGGVTPPPTPSAAAARPSTSPAAPPAPVAPRALDAEGGLLRALTKEAEPLFALVDAARSDRVLAILRDGGEVYQSLYEGVQGEVLAAYAPYLVQLPRGSRLLGQLLREGWGKSWGVYVTCARPFQELRKHFRHFLLVKTEEGEELYFRFYDPRVLRLFLPTCTPQEAREFFGPIRSFLVEDAVPARMLRFTPDVAAGSAACSVAFPPAEAR